MRSHPRSEQLPAPPPRTPLSVAEWLEDPPPAGPGPVDSRRYRDLLKEVIDPELGVNIVDLGMVYDIHVTDGLAQVRMTMTTPGCPLGAYLDDAVRTCLDGAPGVDDVEVRIVWDPPWSPEMMSDAAKAQLGWRR